ncbi:MAG: hypothetical protein QGH51_04605 [Planctomycetota bacterium]|jgi:ABC-type uncharacterized transport system permease subunit|nr:hypothetical protein [Planctomycetota bacterium]MDP6941292.1 hypothetical protein [Planctomycetota bacterium]
MAYQNDDLPMSKLFTITVVGTFLTLALVYLVIGAFHDLESQYAAENTKNLGAESAAMEQSQKSDLGDIQSAMSEVADE